MGRPKKSQRSSDTEIKDRILTVAEQLFARKGYSSTTTREIAAAAGVNKALISYYFSSKENLYKTIIIGNMDTVFEAIIGGLAQDLSAEEVIDVIVDSYYDLFHSKPDILPSLFARELADGAPFITAIIPDRCEQVVPAYKQAIHAQTLCSGDLVYLIFTIGVIVITMLMKPAHEALGERLNISIPDSDEMKSIIKNFIRKGLAL